MTDTVVSFLSVGGLGFAAIVYGLDRFNLLPKKRSPMDAAAEVVLADRAIERALKERDDAIRERDALQATRSLEPILDRLDKNAELQAQVLDRLVHHNGSFRHMEESLAHIHSGMATLTESLKTLTGFILGLNEIPPRGQM